MRTIIVLLVLVLASGVGAATNLGVVSIDQVTYQFSPTQLLLGCVHQVSIRYDFRSLVGGSPGWMIGNTFEIYSPDGADWGYLKGSDGPLIATLPTSVSIYRKHYYSTNNGASYTTLWGVDSARGSGGAATRAAYSLATATFTGGGFVGGTDNGIAVILEFFTDVSDTNRHMCIDTTKASGTVAWEWASGSNADWPRWDNGLGVSGPRCWDLYYIECCVERRGDANWSGEWEPTLADVSVMIDAKFISGNCSVIDCLMAADMNKSGGDNPTCEDITISDISMLIDYLFITGPEAGTLPYCWY